MKRFLCLLLVLCLLLPLCGCGRSRFRYGINIVEVLIQRIIPLPFATMIPCISM